MQSLLIKEKLMSAITSFSPIKPSIQFFRGSNIQQIITQLAITILIISPVLIDAQSNDGMARVRNCRFECESLNATNMFLRCAHDCINR